MSFVSDRVDAALEWSIVGSFTRLGATLRRRLDHWAPPEGRSLAGRVIVMTGGTSGLGLEAARTLAGLGATVEIIARNAGKAEATCAELRRATGNPLVGFVLADISNPLMADIVLGAEAAIHCSTAKRTRARVFSSATTASARPIRVRALSR